MFLLRTAIRRAILLLTPIVFAPFGRAQCPDWDPSFTIGGMDFSVSKATVYDDGTGPALYAVGRFREASGAPARNIARWDGAHWNALPHMPGEPTNDLYALHVWDDGTGPALYVGGDSWTVGSVARSIARWNGSTWSTFPNGPGSRVLAIQDFGGSLYVGGSFTQVGGQFQPGITRWTGSAWGGIAGVSGNSAVSVAALRVFDDGTGPALYAGGRFDYAGNIDAPNLARWDGSSWSALASGAPAYVSALCVFDHGSGPALVAAGLFGSGLEVVKSWNGGQWVGLGGLFSGSVLDLEVYDDLAGGGPRLCAAGAFSAVGGAPAHNVARFENGSWSEIGTGTDGAVNDLSSYDAGAGRRLLAVGEFLS